MFRRVKRSDDMKPNPGGQLATENIVGRDDLIADMWEILEGRSIYMNDLRRVGKTMILRKMEANPPPGGWPSNATSVAATQPPNSPPRPTGIASMIGPQAACFAPNE